MNRTCSGYDTLPVSPPPTLIAIGPPDRAVIRPLLQSPKGQNDGAKFPNHVVQKNISLDYCRSHPTQLFNLMMNEMVGVYMIHALIFISSQKGQYLWSC
jgi:hypothetical protein